MAKRKLPGVFSIQRSLNITDGLFFNLRTNSEGKTEEIPLFVMRHGIRGTQNVAKEKASKEKAEGTSAGSIAREVSNVQITDSAKTSPDANAVLVRFSLKPISILEDSITACAPAKGASLEDTLEYRNALEKFLESTIESSLEALCLRYIRNITNGRWLWRNRVQAEKITIKIRTHSQEEYIFDAFKNSINDFSNPQQDEIVLSKYLANGLRGERNVVLLVDAIVDFGCNQSIEVYPSQNYLSGKEKGFARSLYHVGNILGGNESKGNTYLGQAALRDQKIGNAIRTIDTWYAEFEQKKFPIAVEPNGANLEHQVFFRSGKDTAFSLLAHIDDIDSTSEQAQFLLACVIRGGVYSEGGE